MSADIATGVVISDVLNTFALLTPAARDHIRGLWADAGVEYPAHDPHRARSILRAATGHETALLPQPLATASALGSDEGQS